MRANSIQIFFSCVYLIQSGEPTVYRYFSLVCTFCDSYYRVGSLIANHAVVSNQTNSQHNVIAAANKLVNGGAKVTILGDAIVATSASITSGGKTGKLVTVFVICCDIGHTVFAVDDRHVTFCDV